MLPLAAEQIPKQVWFSSQTPYLSDISAALRKLNMDLASDSASADFSGELLIYEENDSLRCDILINRDNKFSKVVSSFMKEPVRVKDVRTSVKSFGIWMLILNSISTILFFVRF